MIAQDLIKILEANPGLSVRIAETKKHDDYAPAMGIVDIERTILDDSEEECFFALDRAEPANSKKNQRIAYT